MPSIKNSIGDLALFGGKPMFSMVRPIGQLALPDKDKFFQYAKSVYDSRRVTNNGPLVNELEEKLSVMHGANHCITFSNASLALVLLLDIICQGKRGEVIMPAFTYVGLPHIAQWAKQVPHFCDIEPVSHTIDPASVESAINANTTAILGVHQVNSPCFIDELELMSVKHDVPLLFDSVHGIHCKYRGRPIGSFGLAEVFSLHATKLLNGFEGGYITTNNNTVASELRKKRNFGFNSSGAVSTHGLNAKLNEIHAACALASLDDQSEIVNRNQCRYEAYLEYFAGIPGIQLVPYSKNMGGGNYEFALLSIEEGWPITRDDTVRLLRAENALARPYYSPPIHESTHSPDNAKQQPLSITESLSKTIIQMPVGEMVSIDDIRVISELFRFMYINANNINTGILDTKH